MSAIIVISFWNPEPQQCYFLHPCITYSIIQIGSYIIVLRKAIESSWTYMHIPLWGVYNVLDSDYHGGVLLQLNWFQLHVKRSGYSILLIANIVVVAISAFVWGWVLRVFKTNILNCKYYYISARYIWVPIRVCYQAWSSVPYSIYSIRHIQISSPTVCAYQFGNLAPMIFFHLACASAGGP